MALQDNPNPGEWLLAPAAGSQVRVLGRRVPPGLGLMFKISSACYSAFPRHLL